jgi:hypothetical protein
LHEAFGFRTDFQIITAKMMKKIFRETRKWKTLLTFQNNAKSCKASNFMALQDSYFH